MGLHMMPLEKIKVNVLSKINSEHDSFVLVCSSVKTHWGFCEVLGNKHYIEKWQTDMHPEDISCVIWGMLITNENIQARVKKT